MSKIINALDIAKWFTCNVDDENNDLTLMKLQKLVYYAQAVALVLYDRTLYKEKIEAWPYGPMIQAVYDEYSRFGKGIIEKPSQGITLDSEAEEILNVVIENYGQFSAWQLSRMTHEEAPYCKAWEKGAKAEIELTDIYNYYWHEFMATGNRGVSYED